MITHVFETVAMKARKSGICACGKRVTRQTTFDQTINPFNLKDGRVKNRHEILHELQMDKDEWMKQPVTHPVPGYWSWTKEQREEYNKNGVVEVKAVCGALVTKRK